MFLLVAGLAICIRHLRRHALQQWKRFSVTSHDKPGLGVERIRRCSWNRVHRSIRLTERRCFSRRASCVRRAYEERVWPLFASNVKRDDNAEVLTTTLVPWSVWWTVAFRFDARCLGESSVARQAFKRIYEGFIRCPSCVLHAHFTRAVRAEI